MAAAEIARFRNDLDIILERLEGVTLECVDLMESDTNGTERTDAKVGSYEELAVSVLQHCKPSNVLFFTTLLKNVPNIGGLLNHCGRTLLHIAAQENPHAIPSLISVGCHVDARDHVFAQTPLHLSCIGGDTVSMLCLVQAGAGINLTNQSRETPLDIYLSLCRGNMGQTIERGRLSISHTLARMDFRLTPRHQCLRKQTFRKKIYHAFHKHRVCNSIYSLRHMCRLNIRSQLPHEALQTSVATLPIPGPLQEYLLYRPEVLDKDVVCPHISKDLVEHQREHLSWW